MKICKLKIFYWYEYFWVMNLLIVTVFTVILCWQYYDIENFLRIQLSWYFNMIINNNIILPNSNNDHASICNIIWISASACSNNSWTFVTHATSPFAITYLCLYSYTCTRKLYPYMWPGLWKSTMWAQITPSYTFANIFNSECGITFL